MRRTLTILKYVPAVLCGLLLVAWVGGEFRSIALRFPFLGDGTIWVVSNSGNAHFIYRGGKLPPGIEVFPNKHYNGGPWAFGSRNLNDTHLDWCYLIFSIPLVLTLAGPLSLGCLTRFRFPLWSWFAWTALIAAELAYYLR